MTLKGVISYKPTTEVVQNPFADCLPELMPQQARQLAERGRLLYISDTYTVCRLDSGEWLCYCCGREISFQSGSLIGRGEDGFQSLALVETDGTLHHDVTCAPGTFTEDYGKVPEITLCWGNEANEQSQEAEQTED